MCNENIVLLLDKIFSQTGDQSSWTTNSQTPVTTADGQLILRSSGQTVYFQRTLGEIGTANNRIRLRVNLDITRSTSSPDANTTVAFGIYQGSTLIDTYTVCIENIGLGQSIEYNLDRIYIYNQIEGPVSVRVTVPEGWNNKVALDYLKAETFKFCDDKYRTYFLLDNIVNISKPSVSGSIRLIEWKVDDEETLTADFFAENNSNGHNPLQEWKFAKADIDGQNRVAETEAPITFNPFFKEWGLLFDNGDYFSGKVSGTQSGSDYGDGITTLGLDKPCVLNGNLVNKRGAFFIDIDYTKNLRISFDVRLNTSDTGTIFSTPSIYRRYFIIWDAVNCRKRFYYINLNTLSISASRTATTDNRVDVIEDGFLSGITGDKRTRNVFTCEDTIDYNGDAGAIQVNMNFSEVIGDAGIQYTANDKPVKFTIIWNGQTVTTGYVGSDAYDSELLSLGIPQSEINTGSPSTGSGILSFLKSTATPSNALVKAESPLDETEWSFDGICPTGPRQSIEVGEGICKVNPRRWDQVYVDVPNPNSYTPVNGDVIYTDAFLTGTYDGADETFRMRTTEILEFEFKISSAGVISGVLACPPEEVITVVTNNVSDCNTCFEITVTVPSGQTRNVQFSSSFAPSGTFSDFCTDPPSTHVTTDFTEKISATKTYTFGITGDNTFTPHQTSSINVLVTGPFGQFIAEETFSRDHFDKICAE